MKTLLLLLMIPSPLLAATGSTGGALLQEPFGARPFAMGQAYAAVGDDLYGMAYNPATLSRLQDSQAAAQMTQSFDGIQLGYMGFATPLNPVQALGLSVAYLDAGRAEVFDASGAQTRTASAERDFLVALGYSHVLDMGPAGLHLGVSGKALKSTVFDDAQTTAYAVDLGSLYGFHWGGGLATLAAAASNLGTKIRYSGGLAQGAQSDPLPLTTRLAAGYAKDLFAADSFALGAEVDRVFYDNSLFESIGMEYTYRQLVSLRLGYRLGEDVGNLSMGMGFHYKSLSIDYGLALAQTLNNVQQFSFRYRFSIPGIRYPQSSAAGPTALDTMVQRVRVALAGQRYFDAAEELDRLNTVFPHTEEGSSLSQQIDREIEQIILRGSLSRRYEYGLAFNHYHQGRWREAVTSLEACSRKNADNHEIPKYLEKARKKVQEFERETKLELGARVGMLFELANSAYEQKDYPRATRIINEILRLSNYQPAESLKRRIERAQTEKSVQPVLRPSSDDISRSEQLYYEALRFYADNNVARARNYLQQAVRLNPDSETIRTALQGIEKELKKSGSGAPQP